MKLKGMADFQRKLKRIGGTEMRRAASSALNKTGALARTRIIRGAAKATTVPIGLMRKRVFLARASAKNMTIVQTGYSRPISLIDMVRTVKADVGQRRRRRLRVRGKVYPHAFIREMPSSGKILAVERNGKKGRQGKGRWAKYKNLEKIDAVTIPIHRKVNEILPNVNQRVYQQHFRRLFAHEYNFRLSRL